jgi:transcriptional regulator with XRE-family HTH domain
MPTGIGGEWYPIRYHRTMIGPLVIAEIRRRSGTGLRELARRAGTSHATLHAYESGAKEPRIDTLVRVAAAAGFAIEISLAARPDAGAQRVEKGHELSEALALAATFPARHRRRLVAPRFGMAT